VKKEKKIVFIPSLEEKLSFKKREREHFGASGDMIGSLCLHRK
jgi:hypothetical protein